MSNDLEHEADKQLEDVLWKIGERYGIAYEKRWLDEDGKEVVRCVNPLRREIMELVEQGFERGRRAEWELHHQNELKQGYQMNE